MSEQKSDKVIYKIKCRNMHKPVIFAILLMTAIMLTACGSEDKYALREQGIELYNSGDYAGAIELFDKAMDASDGQVSELQYDILKYRGECEIRLGDYSAAKTSFDALYELCKDDTDYAKIEQVYNELSSLDKLQAAVKLMKSGSYSEAYEALSNYAKADGTFTGATAMYNQAICAEYLGNYEEAYALFSQYLGVYPDDEEAIKEAEFCRTRK